MSMPINIAKDTANRLLSKQGLNFIAQTDARHILQEVGEEESNYPKFDMRLSEKATHIAYTLISCGCSIYENAESTTDTDMGLELLEKAGKIISDTYKHNSAEKDKSVNLLIAGMALFAAKQFSRAFVALDRVDIDFTVGQIITSFIRKDFSSLTKWTNNAFFIDEPTDCDLLSLDELVISHEIARCFMIVTDYILSGEPTALKTINSILDKLLFITVEDNLTLYWLIIRLLKIIFSSFADSSLWTVISPRLTSSGIIDKYIRLLGTLKFPITELWQSQIAALDVALGENSGGIINLRTSGGKTRIAELAILQTLSENTMAKILYLAPFRSLAFEIEQTLSRTFSPLGFAVTQLYGGATINLSDFELIELSHIIIATPEKAKALIRGGSGIETEIQLIIVDEGHLLGADKRNIRNEMFLTHIKEYASRKQIRILLMSAVLPNAAELAEWIADDKTLVGKSNWKPSRERLGLLLWDGSKVRLEWKSDEKPFNPNFICKAPIGYGKRRNQFPNDKQEAVAATAVRLAKNGTVMIFSARANTIKGLADSVLLALGETPSDFEWDTVMWNIFENTCKEELGEDSIILKSARKGIICHSNKLPTPVRIEIEKLMRSKPPFIIIATSTLGQGVNVGITTVIVNLASRGNNEYISCLDFWNICGRAGRAYSDSEGKILYAIDCDAKKRKQWQIYNDQKLAESYFEKSEIDTVKSGILAVLKYMLRISIQSNVDFEHLLELIANDFAESSIDAENTNNLIQLFDWLDDELLAMHQDFTDETDSVDWVDTLFRRSLAIIQAIESDKEMFISILKHRVKGITTRITDKTRRQRLTATGIPLSVSHAILDSNKYFRSLAMRFIVDWKDNPTPDTLSDYIRVIEIWTIENAKTLLEDKPVLQSTLDSIRRNWLAGIPLATISIKEEKTENEIAFYEYTLPWVTHAISRTFDVRTEEEIIKVYSLFALLIELGLPNETSANIYLAGVRSRSASVELAHLDMMQGLSSFQIKSALLNIDLSKTEISDNAKVWIESITKIYKDQLVKSISPLRFDRSIDESVKRLYIKKNNEAYYLVSPDGYFQIQITGVNNSALSETVNRRDLYFEKTNGFWSLRSFSPQIRIE